MDFDSSICTLDDSNFDDTVRNLDDSNFDDTVRNNKFVLVTFYVSGCRHLEKLTSKCANAAKLLSNSDSPIIIAKVNADEERIPAFKYGIWTYPVITIFTDGGKKVQEYHGPADGLVECLKRLRGPFPTKIESAQDAENLIGREKTVIVGVFPEFSGAESSNFIKAAEKLQCDYDFGLTLDGEHLPNSESSVVVSVPVVRVFKPVSIYNDKRFVDTRIFYVDALVKFVEEASTPIVTLCNHNPRLDVLFFHSKLDYAKAMLFIDFECHEDFKSKYCEFAKDRGEGINFMLGYIKDSQVGFWYFDLHESQVPLIVIRNPQGETYVKVDFQNPDDITTWLEDYKANELTEYGTPNGEKKENVMVVVDDAFEKMVKEPGKNVFVWLGPWCHWCDSCKLLGGVLDQVAHHFEEKMKNAGVVIVKLYKNAHEIRRKYDISYNEDEPYNMCFKRAGGEKLYLYHGQATKDAIIQFIRSNKGRVEPIEVVVKSFDGDGKSKYWKILEAMDVSIFLFQEKVLDSRSNVLLFYYSSEWLREHYKFSFDLENLAEDFKTGPHDVVITLIEARIALYPGSDANNALRGVIHHFKTYDEGDEPTIFLKLANGEIVAYENYNNRIATEDIKNFIMKEIKATEMDGMGDNDYFVMEEIKDIEEIE